MLSNPDLILTFPGICAFPGAPGPSESEQMQLSEIISALTFALDLTEGALPGHSLRCCLLGMRIGVAAGLSFGQLASLYYALQLKDAGCSSNAARLSAMVGGGDERALKNASKLTDWTRPNRPDPRYLRELWRQCRPGGSLLERAKHLFQLAGSPENHTQEMITLRCERGGAIATHLQLGGPVAEAVRGLDEHWDGSGYPEGRRGAEIPVLSRICLIAQHLDAYAAVVGTERAVRELNVGRKFWYDPDLAGAVRALHRAGQLWQDCLPSADVEATRRAVLALDPGVITEITDRRIDRICEAFAGIVDAKSPFTYRHSMGVMQVACAIATELDLSQSTCDTIRRAALLHDVGKLAISNAILDKTSKLTEQEWALVRQHPTFSGSILRRVPNFHRVAQIAEQHHERLDGTGYPHQLRRETLSIESRVVAMADCYSAMAEDRPYRKGRPREQVLSLLATDIPGQLDPVCFDALKNAANSWQESFPEHAELDPGPDPITAYTPAWNWAPVLAGPVS